MNKRTSESVADPPSARFRLSDNEAERTSADEEAAPHALEGESQSSESVVMSTPENVVMSSPEGVAMSSPEGLAMSTPESVAMSTPENVVMSSPEGETVSSNVIQENKTVDEKPTIIIHNLNDGPKEFKTSKRGLPLNASRPASTRIRLSSPKEEKQSASEETVALASATVNVPSVSNEPVKQSSNEDEEGDSSAKPLEAVSSKVEVIEETAAADIEETAAADKNKALVVSHQTASYVSGNWLSRGAASATTWILEKLGLRDTDPRYHVIVDTNMALQTLMDLYTVRAQLQILAGKEMMLVFPRLMMEELERIKTGTHVEGNLQAKARDSGRIIEEWDEAGVAFLQDKQDSDKSLEVFKSFKCDNTDDKIIHTALQYKYQYGKKNVGVFTMDRGMRATVRPMKFRTFCIRTPDEANILAKQKKVRAAVKQRKPSKASQQSVSMVLANRSASTAAPPSTTKPHYTEREEDVRAFFKAVFDRVTIIRDNARTALSSPNCDKKKRALAVESLRLLHLYVSTICDQFGSAITSSRTGAVFNPSATLHDTLSSFVAEYNVQTEMISCGLLHRLCRDSKMGDMADGGLTEMRGVLKTIDDAKRFLLPEEMF